MSEFKVGDIVDYLDADGYLHVGVIIEKKDRVTLINADGELHRVCPGGVTHSRVAASQALSLAEYGHKFKRVQMDRIEQMIQILKSKND